jgi:hypothetical protein
MELFRKTRLKTGNSILTRKIAKQRRKISYSGMEKVKTMGIVWDASSKNDFTYLSRFHQKMIERGIDVKIFGYYPEKELPDQYTAIRFLTCMKRDETSFFYLPLSREADIFIRNSFDVLIDINFNSELPLAYLTSLSLASFKVGLTGSYDGPKTFDLMMEFKKPVQIENYLNEIIRYLEMIKS